MARRFGSVRRLDSGRYQALYTNTENGRQVSKTFDKRVDAERWLDLERARMTTSTWHDTRAARQRLNDFFEDWLGARQLAPRTVELYSMLWRLHVAPTIGRRALGELSPAVVRRWHGELLGAGRTGAVTAAKAYRLLSAVTNDAARDGAIQRTPCLIRGAGSERAPEVRTISASQVLELANHAPEHLKAFVLVAGFGGLRWGELTGLALGSVRIDIGCVRVERTLQDTRAGLVFGPPKTRAGYRTVHLPRVAVDALDEHLQMHRSPLSKDLVFTTVTGCPLRRPNFTKPWRQMTAAAGQNGLRFHDLRHTAATLATVHGATLREVQARLGHSTPHAAMRYQHALLERDSQIAQRLDVALRQKESS
jgi:integrase